MMRKSICKWLLTGLSCFASLSAQEANTLYFIEKNPVRHQLNPAYQPEGKLYVGMPGLSSLNFSVGNNCLTFEDLFQGKTIDGEKQTVSFLSRYADDGIDHFLGALDSKLRIYTDYNWMLLSFGYRIKEKHYVTFGLSNRADVQVTIPKALPEVLLKGNPDVDACKSFDIEDLFFESTLYSELAFGYSQAYNEKFTFGAKYKFLLGHANTRTHFDDLSLTISKDEWKLTGDGSIDMSVPTMEITENEDGTIDELEFSDGSFSDFFGPSGFGSALDLGVTYKVLPELELSASVLDLGFLHWSRNLHSLQKKTDFVFDGVVYRIEDRDTVDYFDEYEEILDHMYTVKSADSYTTWLTSKVLLAAEYGFWDNKMTLGLLSKSSILKQRIYEELMFSANVKPWRIFSTSLSYSVLDGEWHNLGLATNFNFGPVNYFLAMDRLPLKYATGGGMIIPTKTQGANFSMGLNYVFGYKPKKDLPAEKIDSLTKIDINPKVKEELPKQVEEKPIKDTVVSVVPDTVAVVAPDTVAKVVVDTVPVPADTVAKAVVDTVPVPVPASDTVVKVVVDTVAKVLPDTVAKVVKDTVAKVPVDTVTKELLDTLDKKALEMASASGQAGELIPEALYGVRYSQDGHLMLLDASCYPLLEKIAKRMKAEPDLKLLIRVHYFLDERGEEYSRFVSKERARLVRGYFVEQDISIARFEVVGVGAEEPITTNATEQGRKKNCRSELRYIKE
ncbi:MAG: OmpA family protein [Paludibacteraceae bacterium]|nr:OmpA family protein [Paludibacteraceae bacterium]